MVIRLVFLAGLIAFPLFTDNYFNYLGSLVLIYSIVAIGLNILTGLTGLISLGHVGFWAIGAYSTQILIKHLNVNYWIALALTLLVSFLIGIVVAIPSLRLKGLYLAIATLAFGMSVERAIYSWKSITGGSNGLLASKPELFGFVFNSDIRYYYLALVAFLLSLWIFRNLTNSILGKRLIAIKDSEIACNSLGINIHKYKVLVFALSAVFAAFSGSLYGVTVGLVSIDHFNFFVSISFLAMIVIGGLGTLYGPVLGAVFVTILPEVLSDFEGYQSIIYGLSMIIIFMFWKDGLAGLLQKLGQKLSAWTNMKRNNPSTVD